ncbi:MAG: Xaa-Pro peptidase family protein [Nitriliruptoraceae bacterium]
MNRLARLQAVMARNDVDVFIAGPSADLAYLIGYHALPLERLTLLVIPVTGDATLVVPKLEESRARESGAHQFADVVTWNETDDPGELAAHVIGRAASHVAVQDRLWSSFTLDLQQRLQLAQWQPGSPLTATLRQIKDADEIAALRQVARAIDAVHQQVAALLVPGRREAEVGRDIGDLILQTHDTINFVIVASGPNGASPHHETGDRVLQPNDQVVVDIGGTLEGYCSDVTRNYVIGDLDDEYQLVHDVVAAAQRAAIDAIASGVAAQDVDAAARRVIDDAGFGGAFIHRTGHGIGMEEHEAPWIVAGNTNELQTGMTFSIEPGIYLDGRFGVRIEDIVVCTDVGVDVLNELPAGPVMCGGTAA